MEDGKSDFKKYTKSFSTRLVQTLVQSRLGDAVEQPCLSTADWFNMKIDELGEISAYLKSAITNYPPAGRLVVEFVLYTSTGQQLPLEAWILSTDNEKDPDVNVRTDLYHQMSTLLRSATVAARMTPIHRLYVKKQNVDSFIILYRVYDSEDTSNMGANSKERKIGHLHSPYGSVRLDLHYRTSMHFEHPELAISCIDKENVDVLYPTEAEISESKINRPSFADCVPLMSAQKGKRVKTSPLSTGSSNIPNSSDGSSDTAPKFVLGQSTSSEDSRNSELPNSLEDDSRPSLAELRNHSFPFVSLLQSAYTPVRKINSKDSLDSPGDTPKVMSDTNSSTEKENKPSSDTENEERAVKTPIKAENDENEEMDGSDDSFVEICEFGSNSQSSGNELGELIKQLRVAPEILQTYSNSQNVSADLQRELEQLVARKEKFTDFLNHINLIADNE